MVTNTAATRSAGFLRRRIFYDISMGLGLGFGSACLFWYGYHVPHVQKRDAWYVQYAKDHPEEE